MDETGNYYVMVATVLWCLTSVSCTVMALQHYYRYREVAARHCKFEGESPELQREKEMWARLDAKKQKEQAEEEAKKER